MEINTEVLHYVGDFEIFSVGQSVRGDENSCQATRQADCFCKHLLKNGLLAIGNKSNLAIKR